LTRGEDIEVSVAGRWRRLGPEFFQQLSQVDLARETGALPVPLLIFHAPDDDTVSFDHALQLQRRTGNRAALFPLLRGDHLLGKASLGRLLGEIMVRWFRLQLPDPENEANHRERWF
jgi:putative redox protein